MKARGMLNKQVIELSKDFLGKEFTTRELRLLPYIDFCIKNNNRFDINKINKEEFDTLNEWTTLDYVLITHNKIFVTRKFYDFMQNILAESYVIFIEDVEDEYK